MQNLWGGALLDRKPHVEEVDLSLNPSFIIWDFWLKPTPMNEATIDHSHLLSCLEDILDSDPLIDEVGFTHPSQFAAFSEEINNSPSSSTEAAVLPTDETNTSPPVQASSFNSFFWHSKHKLGISTRILVPLYNAAKDAFMDSYKRFRMLNDCRPKTDETLDSIALTCSSSVADIVGSEVMKHSRAMLILSCDFGSAWSSRKLIVSQKLTIPMLTNELLLSTLILSHSPKSERAWSHRRWVIKMISGKCTNLREIVQKESNLVNALAENSKMNYRAWNHRCWLVSYMSNAQTLHELQSSVQWAEYHVADNSCFHYRARLLLQLMDNLQHNDNKGLTRMELCQIWKEELDWVKMLIGHFVGREALWLHRRFLSLVWVKHLAVVFESKCCHSHCKSCKNCDISSFIKDEVALFHSCMSIPDNDFDDYQAQATFAATYILWLAKQMPMSFGAELQKDSHHLEALKALLCAAGKKCLWDSFTWES